MAPFYFISFLSRGQRTDLNIRLYDNAQLLPLYLDAYLVNKSPHMLETVHDIAEYLTSPPMVSPLGGIHAAEDADSLPTAVDKHKREGAYYVWTMDELKGLLTEQETDICSRYWNVKPEGNVDRRFDSQGELVGQNTLCVQIPTEELAKEVSLSEPAVQETLESGRRKLLAYREETRPRPALDDKIVASWNGLAIGGLARTASALQTSDAEPASQYLASASKAASCIREHLFDASSGTLRRVYREGPGDTQGFADDYAFMISGLIDLYEATFDDSWLQWADTLQQTQIRLFWDEGKHAFFSTPAEQPDILIRVKDAMDNAEPSTNGVSGTNLYRLGSLLNDEALMKKGRQTVAAFEVEMGQHPGLFSGMMGSVVASKLGMKGLVVVGDGEQASRAVRKLRGQVRPNWTLLRVGGEGKSSWLKERNGLLKDINEDREMVQLCEGTSCRLLGDGELEALFE